MNPFSLIRLLIRLYPRPWRQRYEEEMLALLEQHHITFLTFLDLFFGAIDAHLHPLALAENSPFTMKTPRYAPIIIYGMVPFFLIASFYWMTLYWYDFNASYFTDTIFNIYPIIGIIPMLIRFSIPIILAMTCIGELHITLKLRIPSHSVLQTALRAFLSLLVLCSFVTLIPFYIHVFDPFIWPDFLRYIDPVRLPLIYNMYESHLPALSFRLSLLTLPLSTAVTALVYWKSSSPQQKASQPSALTTLVAKVMGFVLFITILWAAILYIHIPEIEKHVPHEFIGGDFGWQSRLFMGVAALAIPTLIALFAYRKGMMQKDAPPSVKNA